MLHAVGIASELSAIDELYALHVTAVTADAALRHLQRYDVENTIPIPTPTPISLHAHAWVAPMLYVASLLAIGYSAGENIFGLDWYAAGSLHAFVVQRGEWTRSVTALTLHADLPHLLNNIGFGVFFIYLSARLLGPGAAWLCIMLAAAGGNLLDSVLMPASHVSLGASTAVFAALGLLVAHAWRIRMNQRMRWTHRWAPLAAGVALLGFLGAGPGNVDVLAHLAGFFCGALMGSVCAMTPETIWRRASLQWSAGLLGCALVVTSWLWALRGA